MGTALFVIGLLAFLACTVVLIISLIRKKPYKRWGLGIIISLVVFTIGIVALPSSEPSSVSPVTPSESSIPTKTTLSTSEQNYATAIANQTEKLSTAFTKFGDLLQNYEFGNDEWTINVAAQLVIIRMTCDEARAMEPPNSMSEIHDKYIQGLEHYYTMTDLFTEGIDQLDISLIEQATTEMYKGMDYIEEATRLMTEFVENRQ